MKDVKTTGEASSAQKRTSCSNSKQKFLHFDLFCYFYPRDPDPDPADQWIHAGSGHATLLSIVGWRVMVR
jgi:hypothetical protein